MRADASEPHAECPVSPPHRSRSRRRARALVRPIRVCGAVLARAGRPPLRRRPAGFAGLCAIMCAQQLSTASAGAIWGRLAAAFDPFHHDAVRRARADKLARLGLSAPRSRPSRRSPGAIARGEIDLDALGAMRGRCRACRADGLHGIGPWTADIYLLFCLGHADAWPAGDLALQEAARIALALTARPDAKDMPRSPTMAALARRGGASALGLLSRGQAARGVAVEARPQADAANRLHEPTEKAKRNGGQWP